MKVAIIHFRLGAAIRHDATMKMPLTKMMKAKLNDERPTKRQRSTPTAPPRPSNNTTTTATLRPGALYCARLRRHRRHRQLLR